MSVKHCDGCHREVRETVHTQDGYRVDYYESRDKLGTHVICTDCKHKGGEPHARTHGGESRHG